MLSRWDRTSSQPGPAQRPGLSKRGVAVVGVGTLCLVIGAGGEGDGFCRIARRTCIPGAGVPTMAGKTPTMVGEAATVPTMTGARSGIPTEVGEVPLVVGVIHSETGQKPQLSRPKLPFGDRMRSRPSAVSSEVRESVRASYQIGEPGEAGEQQHCCEGRSPCPLQESSGCDMATRPIADPGGGAGCDRAVVVRALGGRLARGRLISFGLVTVALRRDDQGEKRASIRVRKCRRIRDGRRA
jgi:hypothetical protein